MKTWFYSWVVYPSVFTLAWIWGLFNRKVRETLRLRSWKDFLSLRFNAGKPIHYWVHVASYGELEYAIPILRELQTRKKQVLVTYYSVSAQSAVEKLPAEFSNVSLVVPLPHDGLGLMHEFVRLVKAQGVHHLLLLKYELWPGLLWECNRHQIQVYLVDALKPSWFHRRLLHKLDGILAGYESEVGGVNHPKIKVVGDTRVERVLERFQARASNKFDFASLKAILSDKEIFVCGSIWPKDHELILAALKMTKLKPHVFWVPHELDSFSEADVKFEFERIGYKAISFDEMIKEAAENSLAHENHSIPNLSDSPRAIIVMKKGILAELYRLGTFAYVGGGFGRGVHSVLEPAIVGALVSCGPKIKRSPEAFELEKIGWLKHLHTSAELQRWLDEHGSGFLKNTNGLNTYIQKHQGASQRILKECEG